MNWDGYTLKTMAKNALRGSYWKAVLVSILLGLGTGYVSGNSARSGYDMGSNYAYGYTPNQIAVAGGAITITVVAGACIGLALKIFLFNPLEVGGRKFMIEDLYHQTDLSEVGTGFTRNYWNVVGGMFFRDLFVTLWTLLLIVPGIIKSYEYRMVPYILAEDPDVDPQEALRISKEMMYGEKWNTFMFDLSFIGWILLTIFTCGIVGIFYFNPYYHLSCSALYHALKDKYFKQRIPSQE